MLKKILRGYRSYIRHESGVAAVILALLLPALVASAGVAVDISTAYNSKNRLSNALDKAVLAVGSSSGTAQQLQDRFTAFFNANYPAGKYGTPFDVTLTISGSVMTASASATVPTSFMSIVGVKTINVAATSQVVRTLAGVEAVLVLDTTGSMAGNNIGALKTAATNFINIMFASIADTGYLKIGIVPWSDNVNVGSYGMGLNPDGSYYGAPFVSPPVTDAYVTPSSNIKYGAGTLDWGGCVTEPNAASLEEDNSAPNWIMYRYPAGRCLAYNCLQQSCNQYNCLAYKCNTYNCTSYACAKYNCVTYQCKTCAKPAHGSAPNPVNGICPGGNAAAPNCATNSSTCEDFGNTCLQQGSCSTYGNTCLNYSNTCQTYGNTCLQEGACTQYGNTCVQWASTPNDGCTSVPVLPMTNNQAALLNEINILPTANNTYSDVGMVWGWRMISPGFPFQEGAAYSDSLWSKTVILMTDGNNTINTVMSGEGTYGTAGTSMSTTDQNNKFEQICTNMKAQGIRIYTITFQSAINATTRQFYSQCATNTGMYYDAPTNADLTTAFQNIATQLSQLHLTQ